MRCAKSTTSEVRNKFEFNLYLYPDSAVKRTVCKMRMKMRNPSNADAGHFSSVGWVRNGVVVTFRVMDGTENSISSTLFSILAGGK